MPGSACSDCLQGLDCRPNRLEWPGWAYPLSIGLGRRLGAAATRTRRSSRRPTAGASAGEGHATGPEWPPPRTVRCRPRRSPQRAAQGACRAQRVTSNNQVRTANASFRPPVNDTIRPVNDNIRDCKARGYSTATLSVRRTRRCRLGLQKSSEGRQRRRSRGRGDRTLRAVLGNRRLANPGLSGAIGFGLPRPRLRDEAGCRARFGNDARQGGPADRDRHGSGGHAGDRAL